MATTNKPGIFDDKFIKAASPWVVHNGAECWKNLLVHGQQIILPEGRVLFAVGSPVPNFYYLHRGEIMMKSFNQEGRQKIIWYIEEGNIFAEVPFFCGIPTFFEIVANRPSEVYKFSREFIFNELIPNYPQAAIDIIKTLSYKASVLAMQIHEIVLSTPYKRICRLFYIIGHLYGEPHDEGLLIRKMLTQQEIADIIGVHRVTVNKIVNYLHNKGVIKISGRSLLITDLPYLVRAMSELDPIF
ncbi:CRP-like cAMP-activated global transcriptional regulator [Neomoorella glycerini]|uniref:CRP-like cAMP-activated global transcriptional regulator n=1 Tax=Neomoorella glycerini TaxID=55779 RepID=A0A6I5ZNB2_9FIRM|nr:Crp/Fnr family transcriptional regulator [Moorella glycerini]QGP91382.1 CRP-like cAMP-activated global transcriptional regulator [Moorella glycerini]